MRKILKVLLLAVLIISGIFISLILFIAVIYESSPILQPEPKVPVLIAEQEDAKDQREISENLDKYPEAMRLLKEENYFKSMEIFRSLANYQDGRMNYQIALRNLRKFSTNSGYHTLGIDSKGNVLATGKEDIVEEFDMDRWRDMHQVLTIHRYGSLGLRRDGTVVSSRIVMNGVDYGYDFDVENWKDVVDIQAGYEYILGLRKDGTVLLANGDGSGIEEYDFRQIEGWQDMVAVSAGSGHSLGLKSDGTVVAVGENDDKQCEVEKWKNIVSIAAGGAFSLGLRSDGTVIAVGDNSNGQCDLDAWCDIVFIGAGGAYSYGITKDGAVLTTDDDLNVDKWEEITYVDSGFNTSGGSNMIGLRSDGKLVFTGDNTFGQNNVAEWDLLK